MNIEDFKKALKELPEAKELVQGMIDSEVEGLKAKNSDVLAKMQKLKTEKDSIQTKLDEAIEESLNDDGKDKGGKSDNSDWDKRERLLKTQYEKLIEELTGQKDNYKVKLEKKLIDGGLLESLTEANVARQHLPVIKDHLKSNNKFDIVDDKDGNSIVLVGDKKLGDFVKEWSLGDTGKSYIAAADNGGGGSQGSSNNSKGNVDVSKLSATQKMSLNRG